MRMVAVAGEEQRLRWSWVVITTQIEEQEEGEVEAVQLQRM